MEQLKRYWNSERWFLLKVLVPVGVLFIFYQLILFPLIVSIEENRSEIKRLSAKTFSDAWFTGELKKASGNVDLLQKIENYFDTRIVLDSQNLYSETGFRKQAERFGLTVQNISKKTVSLSGLQKNSIALSMSGEYKSFIEFLNEIENKTPSALVSEFTVKKNNTLYSIAMEIEFLKYEN